MVPNFGFHNHKQIFQMNQPDEPDEPDEPVEIEEDHVLIDPFIIQLIDINGESLSDRDMMDVHDPNFTEELVMVIFDMPAMIDFVGCVNCRYPISKNCDIETVIYSNRYRNIPIAFVIPLYENSIVLHNTLIGPISEIYWRTAVRCNNCGILLSIPALTIYNTMIDEYFNDLDQQTIILDSSSVCFSRKVPM